MLVSQVILVQISLSNQKHLLSRTMCRELFIIFGISEMVMIFTILQALGISNKNTTEDINSINIDETRQTRIPNVIGKRRLFTYDCSTRVHIVCTDSCLASTCYLFDSLYK